MLEQQQALVARLWDLHTKVKEFQGDREKKVSGGWRGGGRGGKGRGEGRGREGMGKGRSGIVTPKTIIYLPDYARISLTPQINYSHIYMNH